MSIGMNGTTSAIYEAVAAVTAFPFTIAGNIRLTNLSSVQLLANVGDTTQTRRSHVHMDSGNATWWQHHGGTSSTANVSAGAATAGAWTHLTGVYASNTLKRVYKNGALINSDTTARGIGTYVQTGYGCYRSSGVVNYRVNGSLSDVAIWSAALDGAEIAALAKGIPPHHIRPQSLVRCIRGIRDALDMRGNTLTTAALTVTEHPRSYA
jgi:large repetitive protein